MHESYAATGFLGGAVLSMHAWRLSEEIAGARALSFQRVVGGHDKRASAQNVAVSREVNEDDTCRMSHACV